MKETDRYVLVNGGIYDMDAREFLSSRKIVELLNNLEEVRQWEIAQTLTEEDFKDILNYKYDDGYGC